MVNRLINMLCLQQRSIKSPIRALSNVTSKFLASVQNHYIKLKKYSPNNQFLLTNIEVAQIAK